MPFTVRLKRSVEKELDALPAKIHDKIITTISSLKENPFPRTSKNLHGREGTKIRVGNYRMLYVVDTARREIEVFSVADRKDAYR